MHLFFDVITALNALTFGNISAAGEKEYLIAVICSCQVKVEVRDRIASGYLRGIA